MGRNTPRIAAIAVVGIAAGLILAGGGSRGPLPGTLTRPSTRLTCRARIIDEAGIGGYLLNLHKGLNAASGAARAGQTVTLYYGCPGMSTGEALPALTTGTDGRTTASTGSCPAGQPCLYFPRSAGDDLHNISQSPETQR